MTFDDSEGKRAKVIMPTAEDLLAIEAEGRRHGRFRGVAEVLTGLVLLAFGIMLVIFSLSSESVHLFHVGLIMSGLITLGVGVSRIFKP